MDHDIDKKKHKHFHKEQHYQKPNVIWKWSLVLMRIFIRHFV